jgi:hypothetical protein
MDAWGYQLQDDLRLLVALGVVGDAVGWTRQAFMIEKHLQMARKSIISDVIKQKEINDYAKNKQRRKAGTDSASEEGTASDS